MHQATPRFVACGAGRRQNCPPSLRLRSGQGDSLHRAVKQTSCGALLNMYMCLKEPPQTGTPFYKHSYPFSPFFRGSTLTVPSGRGLLAAAGYLHNQADIQDRNPLNMQRCLCKAPFESTLSAELSNESTLSGAEGCVRE